MAAIAWMAMTRRSCGSCCMSWTKPMPGPPKRLSASTRTLSKNSSDVSCAFMPIFSRLRPRLKPSVVVSTAISDVPLAPSLGSVLDHDHQVGELAVADEGLGAVDHPVIAVHHRAGLDRLQVRAGAGLGHGDGGYELAGAGLGDPLLLLLFVAVVQQVGNDDVVVQREGRARGDGAALLLDQDGVVEEVDAGAAVLLGH